MSLPRCSGKPGQMSHTLTHLDPYHILNPRPWPQDVLCVFSSLVSFSSPDQACSRPHAVLFTAELVCPVFPSAWRGVIRVVGSFCSVVLKSTLPLLDSLCSASALCSATAVAVSVDQPSLWLLYKFQQRAFFLSAVWRCAQPLPADSESWKLTTSLTLSSQETPFFSGVGSL